MSGFGLPQKYACLPVAISTGAISARHGGDALVRRAAGVGVRADELRAREHEIRRLRERVERVGPRLADDDVIGVDVVHGDAAVIQRIEQPRLAEGVHRAAGRLVGQKGRRGQRAGVKMLLRHVEPHTPELLVQLARGHAAVIGQKQVFLVRVLQPVDELRRAGQDVVAVVDDAVHVAQEAFFRVEIDHFHVQSPYSCFCSKLTTHPAAGQAAGASNLRKVTGPAAGRSSCPAGCRCTAGCRKTRARGTF